MEHFLTVDILSIIAEYLDNVKDFIHLFQINKFVYNNILNNSQTVLRNNIFKKEVILCLNEKLPPYLFQLQNLNITQTERKEINNFNLLNKFKYLNYLEIQRIPENFIFPNLSLKKLHIDISALQQNTLINLQKQLTALEFDTCIVNDNCLNYLNNLQTLKLSGCNGLSYECLQNFKNLSELDIQFSFKSNDLTKYISNLINLKNLTIYNSEPKYSSNFLKNLKNLKKLSIFLKDIYEEDFKGLTKLKKLNISGNILSENCFKNLINLTELNVKNCKNFTGKCLLNLINLEILKVQTTNVKDEYFKNLKNLKELNFGYCNETTGECLLYLNNLEDLNIGCNEDLKDEYFKNLKNLKNLSIYDCPNLNGDFLQYLQKLKDLNLRNLNISDKYLNNLTSLQKLNIYYCSYIIGEFLLNLTNLKELFVAGIDYLKDKYLINLKNLQKLKLENCDKIIGTCLLKLPNLTSLNINSNNMIDSHLQNLPNLQQLSITECPNLTEKCFDHLINLKELSIYYNSTLKEDGLEKLINLNNLYICNSSQLIQKGKYLLNMDKLRGTYLHKEFENKKKIEELKERIRKGETLEQIISQMSV